MREEIARLLIDFEEFTYYCDDTDGTIMRVDSKGDTKENAYWDIDILIEDLEKDNVKILFLKDYIEKNLLEIKEYEDFKTINLLDNLMEYKGYRSLSAEEISRL